MSSISSIIQDLWFLQRNLVSDDYDRALNRLNEAVGGRMTVHEYPTGEACWTWRIPEKWTCDQAYLETLDGRRLIDFADHPLHGVSYSLPFEGVVSREELFKHLHVHPWLPGAIPFVFKYYQRDWGLCAPQTLRDALNDDAYRVVIRTRFEPGTLKVGEIVIPGESDQCVVLVAHLCHPAMVNDDLSGVAVGVDIAKALLAGPQPDYTYRLLILPETIGSVAYLSHNEALVPTMAGGLFLEMLGTDLPHALQGSFLQNSQADRGLVSTLRQYDPQAWTAPYRGVIHNDERQFNSPGVRVPMLSIARVERRDSPTWPYREYHSSFDTPELAAIERLEASRRLVMGMLENWERNAYVVNHFKGEIFCSGYGIWIDYRVNPEGHRRLFEIMERCDGERTVADIAVELDISFGAVWEIVSLLAEKGLVSFSRTPVVTDPHRMERGAIS